MEKLFLIQKGLRGERYYISTLIPGSPDEPPLSEKLSQLYPRYITQKLQNYIDQINKSLPRFGKKVKFFINQKISYIKNHLARIYKLCKYKNIELLLNKKSLLTFVLVTNLVAFNTTDIIRTKQPLMGNTQYVKQTISSIDKFTPLIKEENSQLDNDKGNKYVIKPDINKTTTRKEMDRSKRYALAREKQRNYSSSVRNFNGYLYGFCTWYVANRRLDIPNNWGNAKNWLYGAKNINWPTGNEPKVGAIVVTSESWAGHVGYIETVNDNSITISEMNKIGWNRQSSRTILKNSPIIRGYIY